MTSITERFETKVLVTDSGCWEWLGSKDRDGNGQFRDAGRVRQAHAWRWEQENGPLPPACHLRRRQECKPSCVNPAHRTMELVDHTPGRLGPRSVARRRKRLGELRNGSPVELDLLASIETDEVDLLERALPWSSTSSVRTASGSTTPARCGR